MKTLILVRHAKSSWDDPYLSDFDRPLNSRGQRDAPRMARRLKEKELAPDLLLSSPAVRALTTCEIIANGIGYAEKNIKTDKAIYHASDEALLEIVQQLDDKLDMVMLFGHNPGLTEFVNHLTKSRIDNIPTCGIVAINLPVNHWRELNWKSGKVKFFDFPKKDD
jgi:phosphohistidine phosphatase